MLCWMLSAVTTAKVARADETEDQEDTTPPDPVRVEEGATAPFTGILMSNEQAARLLVSERSCEDQVSIERDYQQARCTEEKDRLERGAKQDREFDARVAEVDRDYDSRIHTVDLNACNDKVTLLNKELDRALEPNKNPFKDPAFAFVMGMVVTGGMVALGAVAVHEYREAATIAP